MNYQNISEALCAEAYALQSAPEVSPRGQRTKEFINHSFVITNPNLRYPLVAERWANPFATIAETLWTLAGRNDLDWLERYIPQCKKWSDDGNTWRAAYGPRLRKWLGDGYYTEELNKWIGDVDQIQYVISKLQEDPYSRQAVISLWDPANDTYPGSKDYPCNNWLQFILRDNKLHISVVLRSNDLIYGFSHNDFHLWSVLQSIVASSLRVDVGSITWFTGSLHVYERHFELLHDMYIPDVSVVPVYLQTNLSDFDSLVTKLFAEEEYLSDGCGFDSEFYYFLFRRFYWFAYAYAMFAAYSMKLNNVPVSNIIEFLSNHVSISTDMFESAVLYLTHQTYNQYVNNQ